MNNSNPPTTEPHWLRQYGNLTSYKWQRTQIHNIDTFTRPLGLVEFSFDTDGRYFQGRADINTLLEIEIKTQLKGHDFRERILLAWTRLRCQHLLLQARTILDEKDDFAPRGVQFAVDVSKSVGRAIENAGDHLVFVGDHYEEVDTRDFYRHCLNVKRILDPEKALARCFVIPEVEVDGKRILRFQFILAHQIADGLSAYVWMRDLIKILNEPVEVLRERLAESIRPENMEKRLPLPQEALYPKINGSLARQRWFWAITRILRHVRKPLPVGFENPMKRQSPKRDVLTLSPVYDKVLDYTKPPDLNTLVVYVHISPRSTQRLSRLCKSVGASLGSGIYALAAMVAMEFHEEMHPDIPLAQRQTFITGFPLNPRSFLNLHTDPDSMMLAFSDGIALPFLSSDLDLEGRIKLLARQAQKQLSSYQKRAKPEGHDATRQFLTSRGAGLVLANQYLYGLESANSKLPEHFRKDLELQGEYPASKNPTLQTHGVSSVGNREALIAPGIGNLDDPSKDFAADFHEMTSNVRARENEMLVGIGGTKDGLFCSPSIDGTNIDPALVERWRHRFETALEEEQEEPKVDSSKAKL